MFKWYLVLGVIGSILLSGCGRVEIYKQSEIIMGTTVCISVPGDEVKKKDRNKIFENGFAAVRRVDEQLSIWKETSEVSWINSLAGQKVKVGLDTLEILDKSVYISRITGGAFDVTVAPLVSLWGFGPGSSGEPAAPSSEQIARCLAKIGWQNIIVDQANQEAGLKFEGMKIDLGGIAQGYAVDKAISAVRQLGVSRALVDIGGEVYCLGNGPGGRGWRVGIQHPRRKNEYIMALELFNKAVSTSGDYENFFIRDNKRHAHIIDPRTGQTVQETPMSVTIIADDCAAADALATAVFVLGPQKGMDFVESRDNVEAVIISGSEEQMEIDVSSGISKYRVK